MAEKVWLDAWIGCLARAETAEAVSAVLVDAAKAAGFPVLAAGEIDVEDPRRSTFFINTWPADWLEFYQRERIFDFDPLIERIRVGSGPFAWSDIRFDGQKQRLLRAAAQARDWHDGLVVPIARGGSVFGLVSLVASETVPAGEARARIVRFVTLAYERLRGLVAGTPNVANNAGLSTREIACVELVAAGKSDAEIAKALGIARSTAHEHVEAAKRKLGTRTRTEAAVIALGMGLISFRR